MSTWTKLSGREPTEYDLLPPGIFVTDFNGEVEHFRRWHDWMARKPYWNRPRTAWQRVQPPEKEMPRVWWGIRTGPDEAPKELTKTVRIAAVPLNEWATTKQVMLIEWNPDWPLPEVPE